MYSVTIVGPGRMGKALFNALPSSKYRIDSLVARDKDNWLRSNDQFSKFENVTDIREIGEVNSDIVLITTQDTQIENAVRDVGPLIAGNCIVAHTSGSLSSAVLEPLRRDGIAVGSIHPLVSVRKDTR